MCRFRFLKPEPEPEVTMFAQGAFSPHLGIMVVLPPNKKVRGSGFPDWVSTGCSLLNKESYESYDMFAAFRSVKKVMELFKFHDVFHEAVTATPRICRYKQTLLSCSRVQQLFPNVCETEKLKPPDLLTSQGSSPHDNS